MGFVKWTVSVLALARVIYSIPLLLAALTHQWILPPWGDAPDPVLLAGLSAVSKLNLAMWVVYMGAYVATALLVFVPHPRAPAVAFGAALLAVLLDLGYWISVMMMPEHMVLESPALFLRDAIINIAMLVVLLGTGLLLFRAPESP
jgi:hypothetical protein